MKKLIFIAIIGLLTISNANTQTKSNNYIVLLDLSDRIMQKHQKDYDIKVIKTVFAKFEKSVQQKLFLKSEDSFSVRIIPQDGSPIDTYEYGNLLSIDLKSISPQNRVTSFRSFKQKFYIQLSKLYDKAKFSEDGSDYKGVDIWQYFNESLEYDLSSERHNVLVLLSDGYFDFESYPQGFRNKNKYTSTSFLRNMRAQNWRDIDKNKDYGIIASKSFEQTDLNIVIAGIRAKKHINFLDENNIVKHIWNKWLNEMKVNNYTVFSYANSPSVYNLISKSI